MAAAHVDPTGPALPERFGRYRIMRMLGKGGMGAVYLAHDTQLDRPVALKVPHITADDGPGALQRFHREARAAARLDHPNLCRVYDVGTENDIPYLTMAYVEGRTLAERIKEGKLLPVAEAACIVSKLALAMHEAHARDIVHRDLKPSNVMINPHGEPVVMDFGLARLSNRTGTRLTRLGTMMGTLSYMSPEQVRGQVDSIGPACDIYSLGVVLYQLLTGHVPFEGPTEVVLGQILTQPPPKPSSFRPDLDPRLEAVCLRAIQKEVAARYASMDQFAAALNACLKTPAPPIATVVPAREATAVPAANPTARHEARPVQTHAVTVRSATPARTGQSDPFAALGQEAAKVAARRPVAMGTGGIVLAVALVGLTVVAAGGLVVFFFWLRSGTSPGLAVVAVPKKDDALIKKDNALTRKDDTLGKKDDTLVKKDDTLDKKDDALAKKDDTFPVTPPPVTKTDTTVGAGVVSLTIPGEKRDTLTATDPVVDVGKPTKSYKAWLFQGREYVIDMKADQKFDPSKVDPKGGLDPKTAPHDPYLRLLDSDGKEVARNDDVVPAKVLDAQIKYSPAQTGEYTIQATVCDVVPAGGMPFTLTVTSLPILLPVLRRLEGEHLKIAGQSGNFIIFRQDMKEYTNAKNRWSEDAQLFAKATAPQSWVDLEVPITTDGRYQVTAFLGSFDYGIVRLTLNGQPIGLAFDGYQPGTAGPIPLLPTVFDLKRGTAMLRILVTGANPKTAKGCFYWGLDYLELFPLPSAPILPDPVVKVDKPAPVWKLSDLVAGRILAPDFATVKPLFRNDFDNPKSGPPTEKLDGIETGYSQGRYFIKGAPGCKRWYGVGPAFANFACELQGRVLGPASDGWALAITTQDSAKKNRGIQVSLSSEAQLRVSPWVYEDEPARGPKVGPISHAAIKRGAEFNKVLVVVRGRVVEVYVNGVAMCPPVTVDRDFAPGGVLLQSLGRNMGVHVEFERITVWPVDSLPPPAVVQGPDPKKKTP